MSTQAEVRNELRALKEARAFLDDSGSWCRQVCWEVDGEEEWDLVEVMRARRDGDPVRVCAMGAAELFTVGDREIFRRLYRRVQHAAAVLYEHSPPYVNDTLGLPAVHAIYDHAIAEAERELSAFPAQDPPVEVERELVGEETR